MFKGSILFLFFIIFCSAQEGPNPRQVVIGGTKTKDFHIENDPIKLLASFTPSKSILNYRPGYKKLLTKSLCSHSEPLGPDIVISCAACLAGTCMTYTNFPHTSLYCNLSANCLVSCLFLCYWIQDTPQEFNTGILAKKIKSDVLHYLCCGAKKNE